MTVREVSKMTGVTVRSLQYYDKIGLLKPTFVSENGYRHYDNNSLIALGKIIILKELGFTLAQIREILKDDNSAVLGSQIELLKLKKEQIERLISLAEKLKKGEIEMDINYFNAEKQNEYKKQAARKYGGTKEYKEYKSKNLSAEKEQELGEGLMKIFAEIGAVKHLPPESESAQNLIKKLQTYITDNFYFCSNGMLLNLAEMYVAGGEMTENIDKAGGSGTARFTNTAIKFYVK